MIRAPHPRPSDVEFGLDTFGDVTDGLDGHRMSQPEVLRNVVAEGVLADSLGIDFFGVGEHHRDDFAVSTDVLDALVARLERTPGVHGARLTGAGFGGCVVALADPGALDEGWLVRASDGARVDILD